MSAHIFSQLDIYPNPKLPTTIPFNVGTPHKIHKVVHTNLMSIVPNVDIGYYCETYTPADLETWIALSKTYANELNREYQERCDDALKHLRYIEDQKIKCQALDLVRVENLPDDIIRVIYGFLLPETRIQLLEARYPNYLELLSKMKVPRLKKFFQRALYNPYFFNMLAMRSNTEYLYAIRKNYKNVCFFVPPGFKNKVDCLRKIKVILDGYKYAVPERPEIYYHLQKKALRILQTIVFFARV